MSFQSICDYSPDKAQCIGTFAESNGSIFYFSLVAIPAAERANELSILDAAGSQQTISCDIGIPQDWTPGQLLQSANHAHQFGPIAWRGQNQRQMENRSKL
jgi:hypothetical protein